MYNAQHRVDAGIINGFSPFSDAASNCYDRDAVRFRDLRNTDRRFPKHCLKVQLPFAGENDGSTFYPFLEINSINHYIDTEPQFCIEERH